MKRERISQEPNLRLTPKDFREIANAYIKLATDYPVWTGILAISEAINAIIVIERASQGIPFSPDEVKERFTLASLIGLLGGGAGEALLRAGKWLLTTPPR